MIRPFNPAKDEHGAPACWACFQSVKGAPYAQFPALAISSPRFQTPGSFYFRCWEETDCEDSRTVGAVLHFDCLEFYVTGLPHEFVMAERAGKPELYTNSDAGDEVRVSEIDCNEDEYGAPNPTIDEYGYHACFLCHAPVRGVDHVRFPDIAIHDEAFLGGFGGREYFAETADGQPQIVSATGPVLHFGCFDLYVRGIRQEMLVAFDELDAEEE